MPAAVSARPLPLDEIHREAGCAAWTEEGGYLVPRHYGDAVAERDALSGEAALYDASAWGRVELLGPDARLLLHSFCTVDIQRLEPGVSRYGLIPALKGQVLADAVIGAHESRLWLRLPPGQGRPVRHHLAGYVITEQIELLPMGEMIPLWVVGPGAAERLVSAGVEPPPFGRHTRLTLWGTQVQVENGSLLGLAGVCISVSTSIARSFAEDLVRRTGLDWCGRRGLESARIRAGAPRWGVDFGTETLPQEAGLNAAVDYEKGCYLGQEVIARLHYRGREQRRLCVVELEAGAAAGEPVRDASGSQVGVVTSVDPLPDGDDARGIALLRRSALESKGGLEGAETGSLRVIRLVTVDASGIPDPTASGGN